ncbi:MAG: gliding motility-associated C-terminal domain-containing protein, partial [Muricauda sp.]|nr:gliding motility-associated C-terminal domain-containing protein [Allomuricauda sp.]
KTGEAQDVIGSPGCDIIQYTFEVVNPSVLHVLENVVLTDPLLGGVVIGPDSGDTNNDTFLDPDETWIYTAQYNITQDDINNGQIQNQATVSADIQGQPGETVSDLSDDNSHFEDDPTLSSLVPCQNPDIGLIKESLVIDANFDGCLETIEYTFTVTNTGDVDLKEVTLEDDLFGGEIAGPLAGFDQNNDGILSVGETWTYIAYYAITQQDIDNGFIINQATVNALTLIDVPVQDLSDDDSNLEDEPTRTLVPDDACTDGGDRIGLIKTGSLIDVNGDGCPESILFTFTVTNTGTSDLDTIVLDDPFLGGAISGPLNGTDQNNDGILSIGETWTYEAPYFITQQDVDNTSVVNQATVTAQPVELNNQIMDMSDDDSLLENDATLIAIPQDVCPIDGAGFGLIKQGVLVDTNGDQCMDSVRYTFTVTNDGNTDLDTVILEDSFLGGILQGPLSGTDINEDGILSIGESWTYEALYSITQLDITNGNINNQAQVSAELFGFDIPVSDLSDDDSLLQNDPTITIIPSDACTDGGNPIGFEIFNGITPNGDDLNDHFQITGIENYPNNNLKIFNRWGVLVYESDNYGQGNNLFIGLSDGRITIQKNEELPSGTYFYILTITGANPGKPEYTGYIYINRD